MTITYISLLLLTFIFGFRSGKAFIIKGLTLRTEQLFEEGEYQDARLIKKALERNEDKK